ncbi:MAG: hypothetical protein JOZ55_02635 [Alphaproteobacteria bacterium]|nr:hypothetical protein [Alphaproteobacteria bacterium]
MAFSASDLCRLAADLASEHGHDALLYARRAVISFEAEGARDRAYIWFALSVLLDDIAAMRLDPALPLTIH